MITNDERGWCYKISHRNSKKPCPFCENESLRNERDALQRDGSVWKDRALTAEHKVEAVEALPEKWREWGNDPELPKSMPVQRLWEGMQRCASELEAALKRGQE